MCGLSGMWDTCVWLAWDSCSLDRYLLMVIEVEVCGVCGDSYPAEQSQVGFSGILEDFSHPPPPHW